MRRASKKYIRCTRRIRMLAVGVVSVLILLAVQLRPLMLDSAVKRLRNAADTVVNECVLRVLEEPSFTCEALMRVETDADGRVKALRADSAAINRLKATVALEIQRALQATGPLTLEIPLGTLCGVTVLSGLGPKVTCRALVSSVPQVSMQYHFDGAGINQTLHSILMNITVPLSVTLPLQDRDTEIRCQFLIGETVLLGDVPDAYTNVISDPEVADDIFNYGDAG